MMNRLLPLLILLGAWATVACEPTNPFDRGPIYDEQENLKIDSAKIVAFLDTAKIDSLYRIHDRSGVVIIVQKEGVGTRPTSGTIVYTDYIGSLMSDGSVFDTSYEDVARENNIFVEGRKYNTFGFIVGSGTVITGWDLGFRRLRPGSKAIMVIPSTWAYRNQSTSERIPENAILLFDVDFRGID